jgi:hypothetical protein
VAGNRVARRRRRGRWVPAWVCVWVTASKLGGRRGIRRGARPASRRTTHALAPRGLSVAPTQRRASPLHAQRRARRRSPGAGRSSHRRWSCRARAPSRAKIPVALRPGCLAVCVGGDPGMADRDLDCVRGFCDGFRGRRRSLHTDLGWLVESLISFDRQTVDRLDFRAEFYLRADRRHVRATVETSKNLSGSSKCRGAIQFHLSLLYFSLS